MAYKWRWQRQKWWYTIQAFNSISALDNSCCWTVQRMINYIYCEGKYYKRNIKIKLQVISEDIHAIKLFFVFLTVAFIIKNRAVWARGWINWTSFSSLSLGESDTVLLEIEDGVVSGKGALVNRKLTCYLPSDEDISQDPEFSDTFWKVDSHESRQADSLSTLGNLQNVVFSLQAELLSSDNKRHWRKGWNLVTADHVLSFDQWLGSDEVLDSFNLSLWSSNEGSSSVSNSLAARSASEDSGSDDLVHLELPVSLSSDRSVSDWLDVSSTINSSKSDFTSELRVRVAVEPEGEHIWWNLLLVEEGVEDWSDT